MNKTITNINLWKSIRAVFLDHTWMSMDDYSENFVNVYKGKKSSWKNYDDHYCTNDI